MSAAFDIGPLGWVKSEIDSSLERARAALQAYGGRSEARAELKACEGHLHQASGAVQIVGLEGVTRFFEQAEALLPDPAACGAGRSEHEGDSTPPTLKAPPSAMHASERNARHAPWT